MAWIYKQKGSDRYWLGYRVGGKLVRRSLGTADKAVADQELAKVETLTNSAKLGANLRELYEALSGTRTTRMSLKRAVELWDAENNGWANRTRERYQSASKHLLKFANASESKPMLDEITSEDLRSFKVSLEKQLSVKTSNLTLKILHGFFRYGVASNWLRENPLEGVRLTRQRQSDKVSRRPFTLEEIKLVFEKAQDPENPDDPFWRWMIVAGFYLGHRMGDLICIQVGAFDFENGFVRLTQGKTKKTINSPLRPELAEMTRQRIKQLGKGVKSTDALWPDQAAAYLKSGAGQFSNAFREILARAGLVTRRSHHTTESERKGRGVKRNLGDLSFHCLRHSFVSLLKITGGSQAVAKELAGHSSDAVSDVYTHVPEQALRSAIQSLPNIV